MNLCNMKAILTILLIFTLSASASASTGVKKKPVKKEIVKQSEKEVARLYRRKNSRVKKALTFQTKRNKSKLS